MPLDKKKAHPSTVAPSVSRHLACSFVLISFVQVVMPLDRKKADSPM
jgi:hypothetical protein